MPSPPLPSPALHGFERQLALHWPPMAWRDVTVVVAVSGGADSVALLRGLVALKCGGEGRLIAAHLNHALRGEQSDADEAFVVELSRRLALPCHVGHAAVEQMAAEAGDGLEAAARAARYAFLEQTAAELGARYVATAHTADDQAETILHRIVRGTGIAGLAGIERARPLGHATLIRPLLAARRSEVLEYLDALDQPYRQDASNADLGFTRNRIRHELLPRLAKDFNPNVVDALLRLAFLAAETQAVIDAQVQRLLPRCLVDEGSTTVRIALAPLAGQPRHLVRELLMAVWRRQGWPLQAMGYAQWEALAEMAMAQREAEIPPKQTFPAAILAKRTDDFLVLRC